MRRRGGAASTNNRTSKEAENMTDRMQTSAGNPTMTATAQDRPVDGSSHAVHTDDIAQRFDEANDDRARQDTGERGGRDAADRGDTRGDMTPLVADEAGFRKRWETVQTGFVDEPRRAVEQADALVAEVIKQLVGSFAEERGRLEGQWSQGNEASTEDLRVALQRYRSFFDRLLVA
jgi:hypothetical protein